MQFTTAQLRQFLETTKSDADLIFALTTLGFEVESVKDLQTVYQSFIVAEIIDAAPHPAADKLQICQVYDGATTLQVVCGAPNARKGIKVVLAPVGTIIPANNMKISASNIRGIASQGMLCSAAELMLSKDHEGIMELPEHYIIGDSFAACYGLSTTVVDVSISPNRGDALSVYGLARELAALDLGSLQSISQEIADYNVLGSADKAFYLTKIEHINNQQLSPYRNVMALLGYSDNSCLVDVSNHFMLLYGQPSHMYDADKVVGKLRLRRSNDAESFIALGGKEYMLPAGLLVVVDDEKVCAVAGVMGGELTKVEVNTKNIFVETATFAPEEVMHSGRCLQLHSESRHRFERGVDLQPHYVSMLLENTINAVGGVITERIALGTYKQPEPHYIEYDYTYTKRLSGLDIPVTEQQQILQKLGCEVLPGKIGVPSWRLLDLKEPADLLEEIVRLYGLHAVAAINKSQAKPEANKMLHAKKALIARGMNEVITWSFYHPKTHSLFTDDVGVTLMNPISEHKSVMRHTLIATLLECAKENMQHGYGDLAIFESGKSYHLQPLREINALAGLRVGMNKSSWRQEKSVCDFLQAKTDVLTVLEHLGLGVEKINITRDTPSYYHPGQSAALLLGKQVLAFVGALHPNFTADKAMVGFEIFIDNVPFNPHKKPGVLKTYALQAIDKDLAFVVDKKIMVEEVMRTIRSAEKKWLKKVELFDVFVDSQKLGGAKHSLAFRLTLQPLDKSFTDEEIADIMQNIIQQVEEKHQAVLRG